MEKFKANRETTFEAYGTLLEKLPEEMKKDFQDVIDAHFDFISSELEQNFMEGFACGVRLMTEVFCLPFSEN